MCMCVYLYIYIYICTYIYIIYIERERDRDISIDHETDVRLDSLRGSSVKIGTMQRLCDIIACHVVSDYVIS